MVQCLQEDSKGLLEDISHILATRPLLPLQAPRDTRPACRRRTSCRPPPGAAEYEHDVHDLRRV